MDLTASNQIREALPSIIREFQRSIPKPESSHWQTQSVFVQFISIAMTNAGRQSGAPTFKAHFKIVSQNAKTLWIFFNRRRSQLESLIKDVIKQQNKGRCIKCGHTNMLSIVDLSVNY